MVLNFNYSKTAMQAVKRVQPSLVALHKMAKIKIFVKSKVAV